MATHLHRYAMNGHVVNSAGVQRLTCPGWLPKLPRPALLAFEAQLFGARALRQNAFERDATYAEYGLTVSTTEQARERAVDSLASALGLAEGATIFDQCCGIGRIAVPLARRGYRVIGVDQMPDYVRRAARPYGSTRTRSSRC